MNKHGASEQSEIFRGLSRAPPRPEAAPAQAETQESRLPAGAPHKADSWLRTPQRAGSLGPAPQHFPSRGEHTRKQEKLQFTSVPERRRPGRRGRDCEETPALAGCSGATTLHVAARGPVLLVTLKVRKSPKVQIQQCGSLTSVADG